MRGAPQSGLARLISRISRQNCRVTLPARRRDSTARRSESPAADLLVRLRIARGGRRCALAGRQPVVIRVRKSPDTKRITTDWKATDQNGAEYNIRTAVDPLLGDGAHGFYIDMMAETGVAV